ncbi:MAG: 16S rRNA (guanine(527)-N(7))-methyltransferase RsmG [Fuerstiella sp.]|nr:16S rRNA (guanine(527)-N(7))-methyltransferase RsmG [Fuerstiella sp.]MCP4505245.1 16S rRNA (guanine(527)-N(7))-methyltransferase RsmG [Fuerstiella sp.]MDG2128690.1 16S rRNA (guanine(527)-N(7))-methyltransferase RsmG [Fuerstiella sp.]
MTTMSLDDLSAAIARHNLSVSASDCERLCRYTELLWDWNTRINLTRHTDFESFVSRDLIDTLQLSAQIESGQSVLDVGSGGGVPGIPMTLLRPDLTIALAESTGKKANVLTTIVQKMDLSVSVHAARAEDVLKKHQFNVLTARAVAPVRKLLFWLQRRSGAFGQLLMIKGPRWTAERDEAEAEGLLENVSLDVIHEYRTPGHDSNSVILSVKYNR